MLLDTINMRFHETIMVGTGKQAVFALDEAIQAGGYILVIEGSIPAADKRFANTAGRSAEELFVSAAGQAALILAVGACAAYGGIPAAGVTAGQGAAYFLNKYAINKPLINLPGCPVHPAWFFDTVIDYLSHATIALDASQRPLKHFGEKVHKNCPRRWYFSRSKFLTDWNDPAQKNYCLLYKGCKGQHTFADCPVILWNEQTNFCMKNGAPCAGCTQPEFYNRFSPLYTMA
jgi:hydrogenase small subunit